MASKSARLVSPQSGAFTLMAPAESSSKDKNPIPCFASLMSTGCCFGCCFSRLRKLWGFSPQSVKDTPYLCQGCFQSSFLFLFWGWDYITRAAQRFWGTCTPWTYSQVKWWASFCALHVLNESYHPICLLIASECWQIFSENFPEWWQSYFPEQ